MATEQGGISKAPVVPNARIVGLAFINYYYHVLIYSPELLYKFYRDCSLLSRQGPNGLMLTGTIVAKPQISSPDYNGFKMEIKTVDSQQSENDGVIVLVSGSITFKNNETRTFTQSFLLASQENGYFVLNDIFKFVDEEPHQPIQNLFYLNGYIDVQQYPTNAEPVVKSEIVTQPQALNGVTEQSITVVEELAPVVVPQGSVIQEGSETEHDHNAGEPHGAAKKASVVVQEAPKMSYASILKSQPPVALRKAPLVVTSAVPISPQRPSTAPPNSIPVNMTANSVTAEGSRCDIFMSNLPANITRAQVEKELKKFGAIKPSGVEVRSKQGAESCFGFVEFEEAAEAFPIPIGGRRNKKKIITEIRQKCGRRETKKAQLASPRKSTEDVACQYNPCPSGGRVGGEGFRNDGTRRRGGNSYGGNGRSDQIRNGQFSTGYERPDIQIRNGRIGTQPASGRVKRNGIK